MSKISSTPWKLNVYKDGGWNLWDKDRERLVASRVQWSHNAEQSHANARLIAAAPQMYEAIEKILDHLNNQGVPDWGQIGVLEAALDAARGES